MLQALFRKARGLPPEPGWRLTTMRRSSSVKINHSSWQTPLFAGGLAIANFALDTLTDVDSATAVLYVAVVLISARFEDRKWIIATGAGCIALTLLSFLFPRGGSRQTALVNGAISVTAIVITTYLVLKVKQAEVAEHETRAQLAHISRVTTLGELTSLIAHEVTQPLSAVVTSGNACLRWLNATPANLDRARQAVDRMVNDANRASQIISRIRALAQRTPAAKEWINPNDLLMDVLALTQYEVKRNKILLRTALAHDLPEVLGDRIQLQQVVLNLVINAIEALSSVQNGIRELVLSSAQGSASEVVIVIRDSGSGIQPENLSRVFEPFFTTKTHGMGLGLMISQSIIEAHGGRLSVSQNLPSGASFRLSLPVRGAETS